MRFAGRTLALVCSVALLARPLWAARMAPDTSALEFAGFRAGARLDELEARVRELGGTRLRCDRAHADPRVSECRTLLRRTVLGDRIELWVSAVDSMAGVITLSGPVEAEQLDRWREAVERRYGRVDASVQGKQWMMQWVRHGRMLRLTWRLDDGQRTASLSLVDGRILDAWGRSRPHPTDR